MKSTVVITFAILLLVPSLGQASALDHRNALVDAAERLLAVQFGDGAFPWIVGSPGRYQNVQGVTAVGLLDAYQLTGDASYLDAAARTRDWLEAYRDANPSSFISSGNAFFLAQYALLTADPEDMDLARDAYVPALARYGTPENIATSIIQARASQGNGNLGLWDAALFVRAAQDLGFSGHADRLADAMLQQAIVDAFDANATFYELGLAGLLFGLGESDVVEHVETVAAARDALLAARCESGSWPLTYRGTVYCDDVQSTAYAVDGLVYAGALVEAVSGCDWLAQAQASNGGWDLGGYEIAEVDGEAAMALAQCVVPLRNGVTSYADAAHALV